ncbi:MAG TPA: response regulator [Candidatus Binatia bacterium]|jgi:CheY-like chemotaxis protein|nr:response regulator [Candidatus Binatia bacterium]
MAKLVVISKSQAGLSCRLGDHWVTIGRGPDNEFQIAEPSVSGRHCEVLFRDDELLVRDLRSTNGTYLKDALITEGVLRVGQVLRLGEVELRLEVSPTASAPLQDPEPVNGHRHIPACQQLSSGGAGLRKHPVLLVDDSMAFLEVAGDVFDALANGAWELHRACGADQALRIIQQRQIELAVLDINMPMLDGLQLLTMLHRRHPDVKLVMLTALATEAHRAQCLAAGAELFLEKPVTRDGLQFVFNILNDLLTWQHREGFSGTLQQIGLADLIQVECLRRNSCILEIFIARPEGEIYIESGAIVHAVAGGLWGVPALHRLLALNDGQFRSHPYRPPAARTVQGSWELLLMESARLHDEQRGARDDDKTTLFRRPASPANPGTAGPSPAAPKPATLENNTPQPEELQLPELGHDVVVVSTYDGQWTKVDSDKAKGR